MCLINLLGKVSKLKKVVENLTKGKNDLHAMKRILYDTGPQVVARWLLERVLKMSHSFLVIRSPKISLP